MNPMDVRVLVRARIAQAREALADAAFLLDSGRGFRTVVNRAYYAAFYASLALLQMVGKAPRSHAGVVALLGNEFVRSGQMPRETAAKVRRLLEMRHEDDYRRTVPVGKPEAEGALAHAKEFVSATEAILRSKGYLGRSE